MRYQTVATCVKFGCNCVDRAGVILYDGYEQEEAENAKRLAPQSYEVEVEELPE